MTSSELAKIHRALGDPDRFVLRVTYEDRSGAITERVISPIRMENSRTMLALCLCRESPRRFELDRCSDFDLLDANDVLMPMPIKTVREANQPMGAKPSRSSAGITPPRSLDCA